MIPPPDPAMVAALAEAMEATARRRLGRALALFHFDAGGCGACGRELRAAELEAGLRALGLRFAPHPAQADVLLVSGPLTANAREALERTRRAMPDPSWVIGIGDCAVDGGVFKGGYAVLGGVPADAFVAGCPPTPARVLAALAAVLDVNAAPPPRPRREPR